MRTFQLADVWFDGYFISMILSTERIAQEILRASQSKVPGAQLRVTENVWRFEHLQGKERVLYEWLLGWMCDNGFEPFATSLHAQITGYCFKREPDGGSSTEKRSTGTLPFLTN
jgi:hypothetical protein